MIDFTFYDNPTLTLVCVPSGAPVLISLDAAARLTGVHREMLLYYHDSGLIDALQGMAAAGLFFEEGAPEESRRIEHYRRHLGVGRRALPLVCELRREADRLDIDLRFLGYPEMADVPGGKIPATHA